MGTDNPEKDAPTLEELLERAVASRNAQRDAQNIAELLRAALAFTADGIANGGYGTENPGKDPRHLFEAAMGASLTAMAISQDKGFTGLCLLLEAFYDEFRDAKNGLQQAMDANLAELSMGRKALERIARALEKANP